MSNYLLRYVGTYRVLPTIDTSTNDFPKDVKLEKRDGTLEFINNDSDLYIPCKNKCKIFNYGNGKLIFYCPSKKRFKNLVEKINDIDKNIILKKKSSDVEGWFYFNAKHIKEIAEVAGASTYGAGIRPFSTRNLPFDKKYTIPQEEEKMYHNATQCDDNIKKMQTIRKVNSDLIEMLENQNKNPTTIKEDMRLKGLKPKEYFYSIGIWDKYIDNLRELSKNPINFS